MRKGVDQGRRPELVGGGLIRSAGGRTEVKAMRKAGIFNKGDERILGSGDFVENALASAQEPLKCRYALKAKGVSLDHLIRIVSDLMALRPQADLLLGGSRTGTFLDRGGQPPGNILADCECCRSKR